jgi:hypothetical protein
VVQAQVNVTTYHYDVSRSGQNTQEAILTPSNVNSAQFGKLFSVTVDGYVFAQPLYLANVSIGGGTHSVLYVATAHDSVYAIDADSGVIYWQVSLIPTGGRTVVGSTDIGAGCNDIVPEIGIIGTPVIDPTTGTLYVVAKSYVAGRGYQYLHALNVSTAAEKFGGPVSIAGSVPGTGYNSVDGVLSFNALSQNQRAALLLENGHVVIGWGSHCDYDPWHGWIMSYSASTLTNEAAFSPTPNGSHAGIWMAGGGPAVDASGNIYFATGNGDWDGVAEFGDSIVKLGPPSGGSFPVEDYFTPYDQSYLDSRDVDVASGGVILLPTLPSGEQLVVGMGKIGTIYVLNTSNMGKYCVNETPACTTSDPQIVQEIVGATSGIWGSPAYWNGNLYWCGANDYIRAFKFNTTSGVISTASTTSESFAFAAPTPTVSANGTTNGILWALDGSSDNSTCTSGSSCLGLFAYDATNLQTVLYTSSQAANNRDSPGSAVKFAVPIVVNGKVYVGGQYTVTAFGELGEAAANPTVSPAAGTYMTAQTVTLSDTTPNASIYYTTNGTTPTTSSTRYNSSTPLQISTTTTVEAIAVATGYPNSALTSATYTIGLPVAASPSVTPAAGTYTTAQEVMLSDTVSGATIYYTTDGTTPSTLSNQYVMPISVSATTTINAIAVDTGYANSSVTSAIYTINLNPATTPVSVNLPATANVYAIATDGTATSDGGMDYSGNAYSESLVGSAITWLGSTFALAAPGLGSGARWMTISLPAGNYTSVNVLGTGVDGNQTNQTFVVTYSDGTTSTFTQSMSDWLEPQSYPGESIVLTMPYRTTASGAPEDGTTYLYGYSLAINSAKTVASLTIPQNANVVILAIDLTPSTPTAASPTVSPAAGTYTAAQTVMLSDTTPGAAIYYTTNGTTPTTSSTVYNPSAPLQISATTTIEAIAVASGYTNSAVTSATYTINSGTPPVSVSLTADATVYGIANNGTAVTNGGMDYSGNAYSETLIGSSVTWSGSTFTLGAAGTASGVRLQTIPLPAGNYASVNLLATGVDGIQPNQVFVVTYTDGTTTSITQSLSDWLKPQSYAGESIVLTMPYHLNSAGTTVNQLTYLYGYSLAINVAKTVKSLTLPTNWDLVVMAVDLVPGSPTAASPTVSPAAGTYTAAQTVTLSDTTPNATIYYTTNGTTPTTRSTVYNPSAPLQISATTTVEAIAVASGYTNSAVTSATYTINSGTPVSLTADATAYGIANNGTAVTNGGMDYSGNAYSETLIGSSVTWSGSTFTLGAAGTASGARLQTIPLPAGNYASVNLLATAVDGNQPNQVFVVTYTDGTTTSITQSLSDWLKPQSYAGESIVLTMPYHLNSAGATVNELTYLYGYSLAINVAKTVKSLTLPTNWNLVVMAVDLVP